MTESTVVSRERLHDEMANLEQISHIPLMVAAIMATWLLIKTVWMIKGDQVPQRKRYLEPAGLAVCVLLFIAAIATSVAMHVDMGDNGHVELHLGRAEYGTVAAAILSFSVLVVLKYFKGAKWGWNSDSKPWGYICRVFLVLFAVSSIVAIVHFAVGNSHWRQHKKTDAHKMAALSQEFEIYNLWHIQFHVYAGYSAVFIVLLYGAMQENDKK